MATRIRSRIPSSHNRPPGLPKRLPILIRKPYSSGLLLQRYIFWILVRSFLFVVAAVTVLIFLVAMGQSLGRYTDIGLSQLVGRFPYLIPATMGISIPLAVLLATILTYGRLSANNEILAIRMSGVHPFHAVMPAIVLGLLLVCATLYINGEVAPKASLRARAVTKDDLRRFLDNMEEQRLSRFESRGVVMSWKEVGEDGWLRDFFFRLDPKGEVSVRGEAERARLSLDNLEENLLLEFEDATILVGEVAGSAEASGVRVVAPSYSLAYPVGSLFRMGKASGRKELKTNSQLRYRIYRDPQLGQSVNSKRMKQYRLEYWRRVTLAFSCLVFVLVGAPTGILMRRNSFVAAGLVALVIAFLIYYPALQICKSQVYHAGANAAIAMLLPTALIGVIGLVLMRKALRK